MRTRLGAFAGDFDGAADGRRNAFARWREAKAALAQEYGSARAVGVKPDHASGQGAPEARLRRIREAVADRRIILDGPAMRPVEGNGAAGQPVFLGYRDRDGGQQRQLARLAAGDGYRPVEIEQVQIRRRHACRRGAGQGAGRH